jgi:uncharacterized protein (TIGR03435 family)
MSAIRAVIVVAALTGSVYGQTFEVASIRETDPALARSGIRSLIAPTPNSVTLRNATLREAIRWAYDEPGARIGVVAGPEWADTARYDIVARSAAASSDNELRMMLRALLADRFKLVVRAVRRENAVYLLTVDPKGHKFRPSTTNDPRRVQLDATGLTFHNFTMNDLQLYLLNVPNVDRPVINRTGLDGRFDFSIPVLLEADTEAARTAASRGGNFFVFADALKDLGVRLDRGTVPLDVITIESAERPSAN